MNPGMAVIPLASMVLPLAAEGAPGAAETIFPARTTIDPRSITEALGPMMRTLVMVRSWAERAAMVAHARIVSFVRVSGLMVLMILRAAAPEVWWYTPSRSRLILGHARSGWRRAYLYFAWGSCIVYISRPNQSAGARRCK